MRGGDQRGTFGFEIPLNGGAGLAADGNEAGFIALAGHADHALVEIESLQPHVAELGNTESTGVKEFEHGAVAQAERIGLAHAFQQTLDLRGIEGFRQVAFDAGDGEIFGGISGEDFPGEKKPEQDADGDGFKFDGSRGQARAFAPGEVGGDVAGLHAGKLRHLRMRRKPSGKCFQRMPGGELVVGGQATLDREPNDELLDRFVQTGELEFEGNL